MLRRVALLALLAAPAQADVLSWARSVEEEPNVRDAKALYRGGQGLERVARVDGRLLACRLSIDPEEKWDTFRGPDALIRMQLGEERERFRAGPDNQHVVYFTVPNAELKPGQRVAARIEDRDPTTNERITRLRTTWRARTPLVIEDELAALRCRLVAPGRVARAVAAREGALRASLKKVAAERFDAQGSSLGRGPGVVEANVEIFRLRAWIGRDHAAVTRWGSELKRASAASEQRVRDGLGAYLPALKDTARVGAWQLRATPDALLLGSTKSREWRPHAFRGLDIELVDAAGVARALLPADPVQVAPGAGARLAVTGTPVGARARVSGGPWVWLRFPR